MEKQENYDDEMAFIDITNAHHEEVLNDPNTFVKVVNERQKEEKDALERDAKTKESIARTVKIIQNSITSKKVAEEEAKKIEDKNQKRRRRKVIGIILASAIGISALSVVIPKISEDIKDEWDYQSGKSILDSNAYLMIENSHLGGFDENRNFIMFDNTPEEYEKLGIKEDHSVYIFGEIIGQESGRNFEENEEFIDFLHSLKYTDAEGNIKRYKDFEDFLQVNGYKDKKEWLAESRDTIIERYRGGGIKGAKRDVQVNYEDNDVTSVAKKGR